MSSATRAVRPVTNWAFEALSLQRAYLFVDPDNAASLRVAGRAGFHREVCCARTR
ncbi:MAG: GNAT family N-acetyltransferase [Cryobacterium sp.]|nr:GNAT family N-acetyltransferase [Cryobacterium sp.]